MATPDASLQAGTLIDGKYRVNHLVGTGGMAAVWAGTNERTGKRVALKVIRQDLSTMPGAELLFRREGMAASRVNHPNVVTVFDVVEHEGVACIVMELLDGEPLGSFLARSGPLSVSEATSLLVPAMRGVAAAHAQGVIHRDLKPQNIFICIGPDGRIVTTKVLDFGISTVVERVREHSAGVPPGLVGTPAYMAPEQIEGVAESSERTDVYGFGVVLYEALAGKTPFPGEPLSDQIRRILNEPPPPLAQLRPDLPPGLVRIIETAMAKDPNQRYRDMNVMVSALEDETMPPTLPPRSLTPMAGAPMSALSIQPSGGVISSVMAPASRELSGETRFLFGHALEGEDDPETSPAENGEEWDRRLKAMASLLPPPAPAGERASQLPRFVLEAAPTPSLSSDFPAQASSLRVRVLVGVVVGLALIFVVLIAMPGAGKVETAPTRAVTKATPREALPVAVPPVPVLAPEIRTAPAEALVAPPAPTSETETLAPSPEVKPAPASARASRSLATVREAKREPSPKRQIARVASPVGVAVPKTTVAVPKTTAAVPKAVAVPKAAAVPRAGAARLGAPRAGGLSADDF